MLCLATQLCPTLCSPMDCSPPGSSVHRDSRGKNTAVNSLPLLQGTSWSRNQSGVFCIASRFFTSWTTREAYIDPISRTERCPRCWRHRQEQSRLALLLSSSPIPQERRNCIYSVAPRPSTEKGRSKHLLEEFVVPLVGLWRKQAWTH